MSLETCLHEVRNCTCGHPDISHKIGEDRRRKMCLYALCPCKQFIRSGYSQPDENQQLRQRIAELELDKARLDWLEAQGTSTVNETQSDAGREAWVIYEEPGLSLRDSLDTAMTGKISGHTTVPGPLPLPSPPDE